MTPQRTRTILETLKRGGEEKVASAILKIFGASTIDDCITTYEALGKAERTGIDEVVQRIAADASAVFRIRVENAEH
jgi:hypothetical protein